MEYHGKNKCVDGEHQQWVQDRGHRYRCPEGSIGSEGMGSPIVLVSTGLTPSSRLSGSNSGLSLSFRRRSRVRGRDTGGFHPRGYAPLGNEKFDDSGDRGEAACARPRIRCTLSDASGHPGRLSPRAASGCMRRPGSPLGRMGRNCLIGGTRLLERFAPQNGLGQVGKSSIVTRTPGGDGLSRRPRGRHSLFSFIHQIGLTQSWGRELHSQVFVCPKAIASNWLDLGWQAERPPGREMTCCDGPSYRF